MKHLSYIRYFVIATAIGALFASCRKNDLPPHVEYAELNIHPSIEGTPISATRASITDSDIQTHGFYVAGYHTVGPIEQSPETAMPNIFDYDINDQQAAIPLVQYIDSKFTLNTIKWQLDLNTALSFFAWTQNKTIPTTGVTATTTGIIGQTSNQSGYPWIDIRNADKVDQQIDIIGSKSMNHRNDAVISAIDLDFRHLLSKITIQAKSSSGAKLQITAANIKYTANKVYKKARFTFGSAPDLLGEYSKYAEYQTGETPINSTYPDIPVGGATTTIGSLMLIPQVLEAGVLTLEVKYKISPNGTLEGTEQVKTFPLSANTLEQGRNYLYTLDIQANKINFTDTPIVTPWHTVSTSLPLVEGPKGDILLILDGYQKPYRHIDGTWYWLDRSGYNRHAKLVGYTDAMYNNGDHSYIFTGIPTVYALVPAFPTTVNALSVDALAQGTLGNTAEQTLIDFHETASLDMGEDRRFWVHLGFSGTSAIYFDCTSSFITGQGRLTYSVTSPSDFNDKTMWSFEKKDGGSQRIFLTAQKVAESATSGSNTLDRLETNIIGRKYIGNLLYLKVTAREQTTQERKQTLEDLVTRFGAAPPPPPPTANSYIVAPGKSVKFNATVQGNGGAGAVAMDPKSVQVLWQTGDGVNPLIKSATLDANGQATILTNSAVAGGGNAVVAAYSGANGTGDILWSWHIWVTDYNPDGTKSYGLGQNSKATVTGGEVHTYGAQFAAKNPGKVIMDRNLGALAAKYAAPPAVDNTNFGMFYQWGRKDPFPSWDGVNTSSPATIKIYGPDGTTALTEGAKDDATAAGYKKVSVATAGNTPPATLNYATKNPLSFIYNAATPNDWYTTVTSSQNNDLWGDGAQKSIYDPCPAGWRIAPNGTWSDIGTNAYGAPFFFYINGVKQTASGTPTFVASGRNGRLYEAGAVKAWYPAPGYRDFGRGGFEGVIRGVGHYGYSWSSSVSGISGYFLYFGPMDLGSSNTTNRGRGLQVRCVQE